MRCRAGDEGRPFCGRSPQNIDPEQAAAGRPEAREQPEANPLSQQARDQGLAQRLDKRLRGCELPDVELRSLQAATLPIRQHLSGIVLIDFLPGEGIASVEDEDRLAVRQARLKRLRALQMVRARPLSVISDVPEAFDPGYFDPGGLTLCDPGLLIADALGLPTVQDGDTRNYRRLSLITRCGRIEKVIFPPEKDLETNTRRVISWIQAARW
jgi:hypothetical protein